MIETIIFILLFLALVALLSPVKISVNSARAGEKIDGFFSFAWIIFLLRYTFNDEETEILVFGKRVVRLPKKVRSPEFEPTQKSTPIKKSKKMPHLRDIFSLSGPIVRLFKKIIYSFRVKYLDIDFTFGLDDPAYTGVLTGFLHSIIGIMKRGHSIRWSVDFTKPILEWDIKAEVAITPFRILLPLVRFFTDRQVLRSGIGFIRD